MNKPFKTTKEIGELGEKIAVRYLRLRGYVIKDRNWRTGHMELDIIAARGNTLAFVEVKTRVYTKENLDTAPPPGMAVHSEKQRLTRQAAGQYLYEHPSRRTSRMDVIEIWLLREERSCRLRTARIQHFKAAY